MTCEERRSDDDGVVSAIAETDHRLMRITKEEGGGMA
jgi:hypothetical protein